MCYDMVMNNILDQQTIKQIFWDRAGMTPKILTGILENPASPEYYQVLGRLVERLPSEQMTALVDKKSLYASFPKLRIWNKMMEQKAEELFSDWYRGGQ